MTPRETDCIKLASLTGMFAKIINVICFNYMVIVGEMKSKFDEDPSGLPACTEDGEAGCDPCKGQYATGFNTFYRSMMDTPFFG